MSGLLAVLHRGGGEVPRALAEAQARAIAHRGDCIDGANVHVWRAPGIALGAAHRPTTLEAERERLPMQSADGRWWFAWDGRLDNREQVAKRLGCTGSDAGVATDADLFLEAWTQHGDAAFEWLLGEWAFLAWDRARRRLVAAKDPVGWRQIFVVQHGPYVLVGSEPRQVLAGTGLSPEVDHDLIDHLLSETVTPSGATGFHGVRSLEGGECLEADATGVRVRRWWERPRAVHVEARTPQDYVDAVRETMREATRARLRSRGPLALYLSGGLDSSVLAGLLAEAGARFTALTAYAPGHPEIDEREHARMVVRSLGDAVERHVEVDISDCWALNERYVPPHTADDPRAPLHGPQLVRFGQAAAEVGAAVVFNGDGGDEWLDGDTRYAADALLRGRARDAWRLARLARRGHPARYLARSTWHAIAPTAALKALHRARFGAGVDEDPPLLARRPGWLDPIEAERRPLWARDEALRARWRVQRYLGDAIVGWRDRHVLAPTGVDVRTPFYDLRLIELLAATPEWIKRFDGRKRALLRAAGERVAPQAILDREDKGYFDALVQRGVRKHAPGEVERALNAVTKWPGVDASRVERLIRNGGDEEIDLSSTLYRVVPTGRFLSLSANLRHVAAYDDGTLIAIRDEAYADEEGLLRTRTERPR